MSLEFKANLFKECGQRLYDEMYSNIHILMLVYMPSPELKKVFKKDMFVKANKHAFHQIVYYLLGIINPEKLRKKIRMWPIPETRFEAQFRTEVIDYINELSILHKGFDIPLINKSHIVVPGGFKFTRLMFKLSNLALSQHIQRTNSDFRVYLMPIQALSCYPELTEKAANGINARAHTVQENLKKSITEVQEAAENGAIEIKQLERNCNKLKNQLKLSQEKFNGDYPEFNMEVFEAKLQSVIEGSEKLLNVRRKFERCKNLMEHLQSDKAILEFDVETFPNNTIIHEDGTLDILKLLTQFNQTMNELCFEIQWVSDEELLKPMEQFTEHCQQLQIIDTNYNGTLLEMNDFKSTLKGSVFRSFDRNDTTDSELANPLPETPP